MNTIIHPFAGPLTEVNWFRTKTSLFRVSAHIWASTKVSPSDPFCQIKAFEAFFLRHFVSFKSAAVNQTDQSWNHDDKYSLHVCAFFCSGGLYSEISSPGNLSAAIIVTVKHITHLGPLQILTMNPDGVVSRTGRQRNKLCKMAKVNVIKVHEIVLKFEKYALLKNYRPRFNRPFGLLWFLE